MNPKTTPDHTATANNPVGQARRNGHQAAPAAVKPSRPDARSAADRIVVARGDGIGPEITEATLRVLKASGAALDIEEIQIGRRVYEQGLTSGIEPGAWDKLRDAGVFLKAPITTPQGGGYKSLNVTTRKTLGLYANVRPCVSYHPAIATRHPGMDVVIIRENEEDTYAGIEHRQTREVQQCLKLITRPGCERIVRYAFDYAVKNNRKKITCMSKDNIMKQTDGLFHRVFDEIAAEYPQIETEHMIIDIGAARLADEPGRFDVIVTGNLYGDIISDIAAQLTGSVGLAGSANIGSSCAMFEAIHGSAPDIAGMDIANPSGMILASVMMLVHLGQVEPAARIHNAWLRTIEDGVHTRDMARGIPSTSIAGTREFASAVIDRLGLMPQTLSAVTYAAPEAAPASDATAKAEIPLPHREVKQLVGVDVFLDWDEAGRNPEVLGSKLQQLAGGDFTLKMISNRGVKVFPDGHPETFCTDHWRCRFLPVDPSQPCTHTDILGLLARLDAAGLDFIKTENLYTFDGQRGYSLGQGE